MTRTQMYNFIFQKKCFVSLIECKLGNSTRAECRKEVKECLEGCKKVIDYRSLFLASYWLRLDHVKDKKLIFLTRLLIYDQNLSIGKKHFRSKEKPSKNLNMCMDNRDRQVC